MNASMRQEGLFQEVVTLPDPDATDRLAALVGIDTYKDRLVKLMSILINPGSLETWANRYHKGAMPLIRGMLRRPPLIILAGDVGTGKTELSQTIGDRVAREQDLQIQVMSLSLATRGEGRVGQMTQLIAAAFDEVRKAAAALKGKERSRGGIVLVIDEADSLAQSRESSQMHHEDRAGVNALIRGVDDLAQAGVPAVVIMCTNRLASLDPAVQRRAAEIFLFDRPGEDERAQVLDVPLKAFGLGAKDIAAVVQATGPSAKYTYGFTYSDLRQRYLPDLIMGAFPNRSVNADDAVGVAKAMRPTPPFKETT